MKKVIYNILGHMPREEEQLLSDRGYINSCGAFYGDPSHCETFSGAGGGDGYDPVSDAGSCDINGCSFGRGIRFESGCCSDESDCFAGGLGDGTGGVEGTGNPN